MVQGGTRRRSGIVLKSLTIISGISKEVGSGSEILRNSEQQGGVEHIKG